MIGGDTHNSLPRLRDVTLFCPLANKLVLNSSDEDKTVS
jgi:hypothetical protein